MTQPGLRPHSANVWRCSLPIAGEGGRTAVFMDAFHGNGTLCSNLQLLPLLLFVGDIVDLSLVTAVLFTGKYTSAAWSYMVAVVFRSSRQLLSVQIAPAIKQKENVSPVLLPQVSRERQHVFPHPNSDKQYGKDL